MSDGKQHVFRLVEQGDTAYKTGEYEKAAEFYRRAIDVAERVGGETHFIYPCLARVHKKTGQYGEAYQISKEALPTPAAFRDCASLLRKQAQEVKKRKEPSVPAVILNELYRLAVQSYLCYGPHDCKTAVAGPMFDRAVYLCQMIPLSEIQSTYSRNGIIAGGGLLTARDLDMFASTFGENRHTFDPMDDFTELVREANQYLQGRIVEQANLFPDSASESIQREVAFLSEMYPFAFR